MNKLEVGMYVRFNRGGIKIAKLIENINNSEFWKLDIQQDILENDIIKSSNNIIDLIEVGDYVNGEKVTELMIKTRNEQGVFGVPDYYGMVINRIEVKTVVTKEQFKSIEYRLGDK